MTAPASTSAVLPLAGELADYLALRRALGYRLERPEKLLRQFLGYLSDHGHTVITVAAALEWAQPPAASTSNWWAYRLATVRGFATYLHQLNPAHQVPPADLLPQRPLRACPYLYSPEEIAALIEATACLRTPLRRATFATLIGLLAVTGIRIGEAIGLDREDVDASTGVLRVAHGKFDKQREVLLHPTSLAALAQYAALRDRLAPPTPTRALFVSNAGTRLLYCNVHATWKRIRTHAGLQPRQGSCRPRIHDIRH
ncbi:MAG: tyrosine-type recombinase/integrase [Nocardioidaceae bacterium]